ncbi:MAG: Ribosome hibernation promoting factor Hpf [uncultured Quadrisphaera sp.]|uniref:Ribosome hibernation promoting factor n=1 Tax=uncultured Quadrisphaera sp. TaxID=904978 RepID=A0A6J4QB85_9ACTN|nr:MAG: Ribosome hibernation promoting factor Hpf [uncultured Quadrisphaera sp.]
MEIVVTARHTEVPADFRRHMAEKLAKVEQLAPRAHRLEAAVSHEPNRRQADACERIELTLRGKGPVVRAEASAADLPSALDQAVDRLMERLRRAADRRKVHHGRHGLPSVRVGATGLPASADGTAAAPLDGDGAVPEPGAAEAAVVAVSTDPDAAVVRTEYALGESPVVIRDKVHVAVPMSLDDALAEMELVGHDFFLFVDVTTGCPSVAYRRHGYSYGVIRLAGDLEHAERVCRTVARSAASPAASSAPERAEEQQSSAAAPVPSL